MDARTQVGGILVFWDNKVMELIDMELGDYFMCGQLTNTEDYFIWMFSGVYEPIQNGEREYFWATLCAIRGLWNNLWCINGDFNLVRFNLVRFLEGRRNCLRSSIAMAFLSLH